MAAKAAIYYQQSAPPTAKYEGALGGGGEGRGDRGPVEY